MSAATAQVHKFPGKWSASASPLNKVRIFEHVRRLIHEGKVRRSSMNVVQYLAEITDKKTGLAIAEQNTIADRACYSRAEVGRALKELAEAGVIERIPRRRGDRRLAAAFRLKDLSAQMSQGRLIIAASHAGAFKKPSPSCLITDGVGRGIDDANIGQPPDAAARPPPAPQQDDVEPISKAYDWTSEAAWLASKGEYRRFGRMPGEAYEMAKEDLDACRARCGDRAIIGAIGRAKAIGLYGDRLIDFLRNTWPSGGAGP